jgi:hypothetical protein
LEGKHGERLGGAARKEQAKKQKKQVRRMARREEGAYGAINIYPFGNMTKR